MKDLGFPFKWGEKRRYTREECVIMIRNRLGEVAGSEEKQCLSEELQNNIAELNKRYRELEELSKGTGMLTRSEPELVQEKKIIKKVLGKDLSEPER